MSADSVEGSHDSLLTWGHDGKRGPPLATKPGLVLQWPNNRDRARGGGGGLSPTEPAPSGTWWAAAQGPPVSTPRPLAT